MDKLAQIIRQTRIAILQMPQGPERDLAERSLARFGAALEELPRRVAIRTEHKSADEVRRIVCEECDRAAHMLDALDG